MTDNKKSLSLIKKPISAPLYTVASFDIGIKNLAYCIIDKIDEYPGYHIRKWNLVSLVSQSGNKKLKCTTVLKPKNKKDVKKRLCGKKAVFWNAGGKSGEEKNIGCCQMHLPKISSVMIDTDINTDINTDANTDIDAVKYVRYTTATSVTDMELNQRIISVLEQNPELWLECNEVVLESQIRNNMSKIVYMIFSALMSKRMSNPLSTLTNIKVLGAAGKLAIPADKLHIDLPEISKTGKTKKNYPGRKMLAKEHCELLIQHDPKNLALYKKSKKKDDLADSFLQGLCYLLK